MTTQTAISIEPGQTIINGRRTIAVKDVRIVQTGEAAHVTIRGIDTATDRWAKLLVTEDHMVQVQA